MLFSELYKIMVKKVTFLGFRGGDRPPGSTPASNTHFVLKYITSCEKLILAQNVVIFIRFHRNE